MTEKVYSPFVPHPHKIERQGNWDTEYVSFEHKEVVVKTGEGEDDYVLKVKHIEKREPIQDVLDRDAGTTSVKALMERVLITGDKSLIPVGMPSDGVVSDYTGVPDNLLDADVYATKAKQAYDALPADIRKGRSFGEFMETFTQDEFAAWMVSIQGVKNEKKEGDE